MAAVDLEIARVARRQHGVLSIERLRSLGLSDDQIKRRLADGRLHQLHRGVYSVGHAVVSRRGRWLAAVIAVGHGAVLSHRDGAALLELRAPHDGQVDVTTDRPARGRRRIRIHRSRTLADEDRAMVDGIPVTSVARTLLDLAEVVSATQLQRAYEQAARLELIDVAAITRLLERSNGRRGVGRLRALLRYDPGEAARAKSELEAMFLDLVRGASLPSPLANAVVDGYEVDAYWPAAGVVVELDSWAFHGNRWAFERDHAKLAHLKLGGRDVLAFTHHQVADQPQLVLATLRQALSRTL